MPEGYKKGFVSYHKGEYSQEPLPVQGRLPSWLNGWFIRNGPAIFEPGEESYRHFFDGLALLQKFSFEAGRVFFSCRFIRSRAFDTDIATGRVNFQNFASQPAQATLEGRNPAPPSDNPPVNVIAFDKAYLALSEGEAWRQFEPLSLETKEPFEFHDDLSSARLISSPHPQYDYARHAFFNYNLQLSRQPSYQCSYLEPGTTRRKLLCDIPVREISYMHSFAITPNYIILSEYPLLLPDPALLASGTRPFIENFEWLPQRPTRFQIISKRFGKVVDRFEAEACFAFHHVNAFEKEGELFIDLLAYPDPAPIQAFYLSALHSPPPTPLPTSRLRRYRHRLQKGSAESFEVMYNGHLEMPRINSPRNSAKSYRFVYAIGRSEHSTAIVEDVLLKVDLEKGDSRQWYEAGCFPGEPAFVTTPDARQEDEGLILSVVLDTLNDTSFLLVLDAASFEEIARATLPTLLPFGLHGNYFAGKA
jgi:carotenoid cleavage dioxygenase-like enzyme